MDEQETMMRALDKKAFWDTEEIYTDGKQLIPLFNVYEILNEFVPNWRELKLSK